MIYVINFGVVVLSFLAILNGFLRGVKKAQIDVVLSILLIGLVIAAFVVSGWMYGLLTIVVALLSAIISRPIAARIASGLFSFSTPYSESGGYVGLPPHPLREISKKLGKQNDSNKLLDEVLNFSDHRTSAEEALLDYCAQQLSTQAVLNEFKITRQDLHELYQQLIMTGAGQWTCGHWVAASVLAYPESLQYLIDRRGENIQKTTSNLIMYFEQGSVLQT